MNSQETEVFIEILEAIGFPGHGELKQDIQIYMLSQTIPWEHH